MSWYMSAQSHIAKVHEDLPDGCSFEDRKKALKDAYPFGPRSMYPYKAWCKAQREYLAKFRPQKDIPPTPLEQAINSAQEGE
ncbi:hypothetical protein [Thalassospira lohafexi]|uniref:Uncharacterized protein n=1 Tax=Thalassospira lohafexi TaxID=744227 RepID=A0A2N3L0R0_9PROT|nr:hypothetical protein [Thalassospira lohafexi]PKR56327.1 hypothetical protein COO92_21210 [Thalassospira lohafexi]